MSENSDERSLRVEGDVFMSTVQNPKENLIMFDKEKTWKHHNLEAKTSKCLEYFTLKMTKTIIWLSK